VADRKPRIRKAPPTREIVESQAQPVQAVKPSRLSFLKPLFRLFGFIFMPFKKVLSWILPRYFINAWREVRQVTWPSRRETWRLTLAVFIFAIIFGGLAAGVDKGIDEFFKRVILK